MSECSLSDGGYCFTHRTYCRSDHPELVLKVVPLGWGPSGREEHVLGLMQTKEWWRTSEIAAAFNLDYAVIANTMNKLYWARKIEKVKGFHRAGGEGLHASNVSWRLAGWMDPEDLARKEQTLESDLLTLSRTLRAKRAFEDLRKLGYR